MILTSDIMVPNLTPFVSFCLLLLWKWNNNYSETLQCKELLKESAKTCQFMTKRYFKNKLKHSKRFDHVTDDVLSLFWSWKKLSGRTLLSRKFSLPCDKRLTLYSSRLSLPTFLFMFTTRLNFKCRTSTGYFSMPHTKTQICYLFLTR